MWQVMFHPRSGRDPTWLQQMFWLSPLADRLHQEGVEDHDHPRPWKTIWFEEPYEESNRDGAKKHNGRLLRPTGQTGQVLTLERTMSLGYKTEDLYSETPENDRTTS